MLDIGLGCCVGKDSKAKYVLKEKECYQWSLISSKGSRGKVVGHMFGGCVFTNLD